MKTIDSGSTDLYPVLPSLIISQHSNRHTWPHFDEVSNSLPSNLMSADLMEQFQQHMKNYEKSQQEPEEYGDSL